MLSHFIVGAIATFDTGGNDVRYATLVLGAARTGKQILSSKICYGGVALVHADYVVR